MEFNVRDEQGWLHSIRSASLAAGREPMDAVPTLAALDRVLGFQTIDQINPGEFDRQLTGALSRIPGRPVCVICEESFNADDGMLHISCGHMHCKNCLKRNARTALSSNPFVPAKCCRVIPQDHLGRAGALTDEEVTRYAARMEELTNPRGRLYCWGEDCGEFIPAERRTRKIGECSHCGRRTCKSCRGKSHFGACDQAKLEAIRATDEDMDRLAESQGWKRCPNCLSLVQKVGGCSHITCTCGQDFCYACGHVYTGSLHRCSREPARRR